MDGEGWPGKLKGPLLCPVVFTDVTRLGPSRHHCQGPKKRCKVEDRPKTDHPNPRLLFIRFSKCHKIKPTNKLIHAAPVAERCALKCEIILQPSLWHFMVI